MNRMLTAVAAAASLAIPAYAQQNQSTAPQQTTMAREMPPRPGAPRDFNIPGVVKFTLDNGLDVRLVQYGDVPKLNVGLYTRAGNENENASEVWLADLTGNMMEQGTATRSAEQVALEAANMGGSVNVSVGLNQTSIRADALSENAAAMVRLIADIAMNPKLPENELPRLKGDMARQLSIARSQPRQLANEKFMSVTYPNHPYGRIFPTPEMLQGFSIQQVRDFYQNNFGADRSRLYVVGKFDAAAVESAIRATLGTWKRGPEAINNSPSPVSKRAMYFIDRPGSVQSTVYLGLPTPDPSNPDYVSMLVMNALLGGSFGSRITSNIREQKGYTYSPNSSLGTRLGSGYWLEVADVTTNVTGPAIKEILYEVDRLRKDPPSADELRGIQNYLAGVFVLQNSSRSGIINQLNFVDLYGLSEDYLRNYVRQIYAVTPQQVSGIAQKYIDPDRITLVIAGDLKAVSDQLKPYGEIIN
ncbi:MAG: pitrilysin family protein [Acidobacteriota bacterium]